MVDESENTVVFDSGDGERQRDPVEVVLEQYLERASIGLGSTIQTFVGRLESDADRRRLLETHELLSAALPSGCEQPRQNFKITPTVHFIHRRNVRRRLIPGV